MPGVSSAEGRSTKSSIIHYEGNTFRALLWYGETILLLTCGPVAAAGLIPNWMVRTDPGPGLLQRREKTTGGREAGTGGETLTAAGLGTNWKVGVRSGSLILGHRVRVGVGVGVEVGGTGGEC